MVRYRGYYLGFLVGFQNQIYNLKKSIIRNLGDYERALQVLEGFPLERHEKWTILSSLARDNSGWPKLQKLLGLYVGVLKRLSHDVREEVWRNISHNLNEQERKLWNAEEFNYESSFSIIRPVCIVIVISYGVHSEYKSLVDKPLGIDMGVCGIFIFLMALFCSVCYYFEKFRRRFQCM